MKSYKTPGLGPKNAHLLPNVQGVAQHVKDARIDVDAILADPAALSVMSRFALLKVVSALEIRIRQLEHRLQQVMSHE